MLLLKNLKGHFTKEFSSYELQLINSISSNGCLDWKK